MPHWKLLAILWVPRYFHSPHFCFPMLLVYLDCPFCVNLLPRIAQHGATCTVYNFRLVICSWNTPSVTSQPASAPISSTCVSSQLPPAPLSLKWLPLARLLTQQAYHLPQCHFPPQHSLSEVAPAPVHFFPEVPKIGIVLPSTFFCLRTHCTLLTGLVQLVSWSVAAFGLTRSQRTSRCSSPHLNAATRKVPNTSAASANWLVRTEPTMRKRWRRQTKRQATWWASHGEPKTMPASDVPGRPGNFRLARTCKRTLPHSLTLLKRLVRATIASWKLPCRTIETVLEAEGSRGCLWLGIVPRLSCMVTGFKDVELSLTTLLSPRIRCKSCTTCLGLAAKAHDT